ncbi:hypothetical protein GA247_14965 [Bacteroides xylanisolvens]|nr:hypothetical protein GA247_14965 [Bacteroides xylanisolvens]
MWELSFLYVETSVSSRGNCSSYAWKLNLPACKTGLYSKHSLYGSCLSCKHSLYGSCLSYQSALPLHRT